MSAVSAGLAALLPISPALLGLRLLMVGIAGLSALFTLLLLIRTSPAGRPAQTLYSLSGQLAFVDRQHRAAGAWPSRLLARLRRRLSLAGYGRFGGAHFVLASLLCGALGLTLAAWGFPAPPFLAVGTGLGLGLPWWWLGRQIARRLVLIEAQVAALLFIMSGAIAGGLTPQKALQEVVAQTTAEPLASHLRRATRDLDPTLGLSDRSFLEMLALLDRDLGSPSFHRAVRAIAASHRHNVALVTTLERIASLAHEAIGYRAETRADFAFTHGGAGIVFVGLPALLTVVLHGIMPGAVEAAYSGPLGTAVGLALCAWCAIGYRMVTGLERRAAALLGAGG